jgi:hypothetical protein
MYIGNTPFQGLVGGGNILDASIEGVDLSTSAIAARLGYTPVDPGAAVFSATVGISSGNLNFSSTGQKITGDFSNSTLTNRAAFQTNTTNGATRLTVLPNGTGTISAINLHGSADPTNSSVAQFNMVDGTSAQVQSNRFGTGTYLPLTFHTSNTEQVRIDTSGNFKLNGGYMSFGDNGYIRADSAGWLQLQSGTSGTRIMNSGNGAAYVTIDSTGRLGVGTQSPSYLIHAVGSGEDKAEIQAQNTSTAGNSRGNLRVKSATSTYGGGVMMTNATDSAYPTSSLCLYNYDNQPVIFGTNNTERARFDASGNFGININTPGAKLDVQSGTNPAVVIRNSYSFAQANYHIRIIGDGTSNGYITQLPAQGGLSLAEGMRYYGAGPWIPDTSVTAAAAMNMLSGNITFTTNQFTAGTNFTPTERMRIASTGFVGIGNTSPQSRLHVTGDTNESVSFTTSSGTTGAVATALSEIRECAFNVTSGSNFRISNIVTSASGWRAVFRGTWSNNYEGGGLTPPAPYLETNSSNNSITVGSRTLTVTRDGSGYLVVNTTDAYRISFAGSIEIYENPQSGQASTSIFAINTVQTPGLRLSGNYSSINFASANSGDLYMDCLPGDRTVRLRNWNSGSPNIDVTAMQAGIFKPTIGIAFPATQNASTDANTLDDYEEGTWDTVISTESGTNYTITSQTCRYTKIGNVVHAYGSVTFNAQGNGTITKFSLPFTPTSSFGNLGYGVVTAADNANSLVTLSLTRYSGNEMLWRVASSTSVNYWSPRSLWATSGSFTFSTTYQV